MPASAAPAAVSTRQGVRLCHGAPCVAQPCSRWRSRSWLFSASLCWAKTLDVAGARQPVLRTCSGGACCGLLTRYSQRASRTRENPGSHFSCGWEGQGLLGRAGLHAPEEESPSPRRTLSTLHRQRSCPLSQRQQQEPWHCCGAAGGFACDADTQWQCRSQQHCGARRLVEHLQPEAACCTAAHLSTEARLE